MQQNSNYILMTKLSELPRVDTKQRTRLSREYVKTLSVGTPLKVTFSDGGGFLFIYAGMAKDTDVICWTTACVGFHRDGNISIENSFIGYKTGEAYCFPKFKNENLIFERMTNEDLWKYNEAISSGYISRLSENSAINNRVSSIYEADVPFPMFAKRESIKEVKELKPKVVITDAPKTLPSVDEILEPKFYTREEERKYFKPFCTKVLVSNGHDKWVPAIFGCFTTDKIIGGNITYTVVGGNVYKYCIPWKLNKQLLGMAYFGK